MKVFRNKKTGRIGETHYENNAEILIANARQYYPDSEIEIIDMTPEQYLEAIRLQNIADTSLEQKKEIKIQAEIRAMAIERLKARGEIL